MKCLILAAGYATRLYPLTENFPKPLLDVGGKTILDWLVDDIAATGLCDGFIVISNHKFAHHFEKWADTKSVPVKVIDDGTETNETRLGAVRDVELAICELSIREELLVIAGDNLLSFSLRGFIEYAQTKGASAIMRYFEPDRARLLKCGVVTVDGDDRVTKMTEKSPTPETNWCCPPFYYYSPQAVGLVSEAIADGCGVDAPGSFIAWLSARESVYAMEMPGERFDVGNLEGYEKIKREYKGHCL